jgi:hypothetical protein
MKCNPKFTQEELDDFAASTEVWNNPDANDSRWEQNEDDMVANYGLSEDEINDREMNQ